jgi:hydrogenase maturation protease
VRKVLVIGYGNPLRRDDGIGPKLASAIDRLHLPGVRVITAHQLTPELSDRISHAEAAIFLDATSETPREVQVRPLAPADSPRATAHTSDPAGLLRMAQVLFGRCPPAWWITVPAFELGFGEGLSAPAQAAMAAALQPFLELHQEVQSRGSAAE